MAQTFPSSVEYSAFFMFSCPVNKSEPQFLSSTVSWTLPICAHSHPSGCGKDKTDPFPGNSKPLETLPLVCFWCAGSRRWIETKQGPAPPKNRPTQSENVFHAATSAHDSFHPVFKSIIVVNSCSPPQSIAMFLIAPTRAAMEYLYSWLDNVPHSCVLSIVGTIDSARHRQQCISSLSA